MTGKLVFLAVYCAASDVGENPLSEGEVTELAESTGLENRRRATYRGFESHPLRQIPSQAIEMSILILGFFYVQFPPEIIKI